MKLQPIRPSLIQKQGKIKHKILMIKMESIRMIKPKIITQILSNPVNNRTTQQPQQRMLTYSKMTQQR
jgi:hypothetical protein